MLREEIQSALIGAMKEKDTKTTSAVRMIVAGIKNIDVDARGKGNKEATEADILSMMQTMIKQRNESSKIYKEAGRDELSAKELEEIQIIEKFLPKQMNEEEIVAVIKAIIEKTGASSMRDMGKVMSELRTEYVGQMDFAVASAKIKDLLG